MSHESQAHHEHCRTRKRRLHRDWRVWAIIGLMLAAMLAYVMSDDESLRFNGRPAQQPVPAATGL